MVFVKGEGGFTNKIFIYSPYKFADSDETFNEIYGFTNNIKWNFFKYEMNNKERYII